MKKVLKKALLAIFAVAFTAVALKFCFHRNAGGKSYYNTITRTLYLDGNVNKKFYKLKCSNYLEDEEAEPYVVCEVLPLPFGVRRSSVKHIIAKEGTVLPEDCSSLFAEMNGLKSADLKNADTSEVKDMRGMFYCCFSLEDLNLSSFNTRNVKDMSYMFCGCSSLDDIDLSSFDTHNVFYLGDMFYGCSSLENLDLSNFDTHNVKDISDMFRNCSSLEELDLSSFDTHNVVCIRDMFSGCSSLEDHDLISFNTR